MSTSSQFKERIKAYSPWGAVKELNAQAATIPGTIVNRASNGAEFAKPGSGAVENASVGLFVAIENANVGDRYNVEYEAGAIMIAVHPQSGDRFWVRTTDADINIGDNLQIQANTGRVEPLGSGSVDGAVVGTAVTANQGNEQSDSAATDDLVLVEFA